MNFNSWSHNGNEINLRILTEEGDVSSYSRNEEFDLLSLRVRRKKKNNQIFHVPENLREENPLVPTSAVLANRGLSSPCQSD